MQATLCYGNVTPHVGVWIETSFVKPKGIVRVVTPHVGVWIETGQIIYHTPTGVVTPHVGVWIETASDAANVLITVSLLT